MSDDSRDFLNMSSAVPMYIPPAEPDQATPWQVIGWLLATLLLICSPAIVIAAYGALL